MNYGDICQYLITLNNQICSLILICNLKLSRDSPDFPCGHCTADCITNVIRCDACLNWYHYKCEGITKKQFSILSKKSRISYECLKCRQTPTELNFFNILSNLEIISKEGFQELEGYMRRKQLPSPMNIPNDTPTSFEFHLLNISDNFSNSIIEQFAPGEEIEALRASADGSCLFHSVSTLLAGSEKLSEELRVHTAYEMVENINFYIDYHQTTGIQKCSPDYEDSVMDCCNPCGYSSLWTIHALATIIRRPIDSIYPAVNGLSDNCIGLMNRTFHPRQKTDNKAIRVMWTSTYKPEQHRIWTPNHFVPIIKKEVNKNKKNYETTSNPKSENSERHEPTKIITASEVHYQLQSDVASATSVSSDDEVMLKNTLDDDDLNVINPLPCNKFLNTDDILEILSENTPIEKVPNGFKENCFFVVENNDNEIRKSKGIKRLYPDDMGAWVSNRGTCPITLFCFNKAGRKFNVRKYRNRYCIKKMEDKTIIYEEINPQPTEDEILELHRYYCVLKSDPSFRKRISFFKITKNSKIQLDSKIFNCYVVEYKGDYPTKNIPHGNTIRLDEEVDEESEENFRSSYVRTEPALLDYIKVKSKQQDCKSLYRDCHNNENPTANPRNIQQIRNHKYLAETQNIQGKSVSSTPTTQKFGDHILSVANMIHNDTKFVRCVLLDDMSPTIILWSDLSFELMKNVCKLHRNKIIFGVDKTYNMSDVYVTALSYKHPYLINKRTSESPIMIGPILLHGNSTHKVFSFFMHKIAEGLGGNSLQITFGSDEEKAIRSAIANAFPNSTSLLCVSHLKKNFKNFLQNKVGLNEKERKEIVKQVFGEKGLTATKSEEGFNNQRQKIQDLVESITPNHIDFDNYFCGPRAFSNAIWSGIVKPNIDHGLGTGWTNNNSESINHVLKSAINWKSKALPSLVEILHEVILDQERELKKAFYGAGSFKLSPSMAHCSVSPQTWQKMSDEQRNRRIKDFILEKNPDKKLASSSDGQLVVKRSLSKGRKPSQRKRPRAERAK